MNKTRFYICLLLLSMVMGSNQLMAQESESSETAVWTEPIELVFREYENLKNEYTKYNISQNPTPSNIFSKGACYVSSINTLDYCYKTKENGIKLGNTSYGGTIKIHLDKALSIEGIDLYCKNMGSNQSEFKINSFSTTDTPNTDFSTLKYHYSINTKQNVQDITITTEDKYKSGYIKSIVIYPEVKTISISDALFATYITTEKMDFSTSNVNAYIISNVDQNKGEIALTKVEKVDKERAVIVNGSSGEHKINVLGAETITMPDPILTHSSAETDISAAVSGKYYDYYILSRVNGEVGFVKVTDGSIRANKGFFRLERTTQSAKAFTFTLDNTETNIATPLDKQDNHISYNLSGQRVEDGYRGIVIRNGKKYLNR